MVIQSQLELYTFVSDSDSLQWVISNVSVIMPTVSLTSIYQGFGNGKEEGMPQVMIHDFVSLPPTLREP